MLDITKNCWVKTKILSLTQVEELRTGMWHNNRAESDKTIGVPCEIVEELSEMLESLGRMIAAPATYWNGYGERVTGYSN